MAPPVGQSLRSSLPLRLLYPLFETTVGRWAVGYLGRRASPHTRLGASRLGLGLGEGAARTLTRVACLEVCDVHAVAVLADNWSYVVVDRRTKRAIAVDVADLKRTEETLAEVGATLAMCVATHRHWDHTAAHAEVRAKYPAVPIAAPAADNVQDTSLDLASGGVFAVVGDTAVGMLPCYHLHTVGHAAFYVAPATDLEMENADGATVGLLAHAQGSDSEDPRLAHAEAVFTGDALFRLGVGKFFENDAAEATRALAYAFGPVARKHALPDGALVLGGHEYGPTNAAFASFVFPDDGERAQCAAKAREAVASGVAFGWATLGEERATNPFLLAAACATDAKVTEMAADAAKAVSNAGLGDACPKGNGDTRAALVGTLRLLRDAGVHTKK